MSRWFRLYEDAVNDPKLQRLPGDVFKGLINLWCIASASGGVLPSVGDIAFTLRMTEAKVAALIEALINAGLIDKDETGIRPHNWNARQFKSDVSTGRVKRHRDSKKAVSRNDDETFHETPPEQIQSRAETEDAAQHVSEERAGAEPPPPEPGRKADLDRIEASCREAAGLETDPSPSLLDLSPIVALIDAGYRLESDILPKMREAKARGKRGSSWRYYVAGITEAKAANKGIPAKPETVVSPTVWITTDDPRWPDACAEAKRRIGKEPKPMGSRHEAGVGHHFPAEVVAALAAADAPDRGTFRRMG